MTKVRVSLSLSIDGYGAGPHQDLANPLGVGGQAAHEWVFATQAFRDRSQGSQIPESLREDIHKHGQEDATRGVDDDFVARGLANVGACIMGRNMFGPVRGPWLDDTWKGWWGPNPPFHMPVFVLTHYPRASIPMEGGTTFHFVSDGIQAALKRAIEAAKGQDVAVGGVATIRQYLQAGLVDEMHLAVAPVLLGAGEHLLNGIDLVGLGYRCSEHARGAHATHFVLTRERKEG